MDLIRSPYGGHTSPPPHHHHHQLHHPPSHHHTTINTEEEEQRERKLYHQDTIPTAEEEEEEARSSCSPPPRAPISLSCSPPPRAAPISLRMGGESSAFTPIEPANDSRDSCVPLELTTHSRGVQKWRNVGIYLDYTHFYKHMANKAQYLAHCIRSKHLCA